MNIESTQLVGPNAPNWEQRLVSRLSKTNRADSLNGQSRRSIPESRKRPLTDRDGITLRNEVRDLDHLNINENRPISWNGAINRYRDYIRDKRNVETVFENSETGELATGSTPHRFDPDYSSKQYAKLKDLERGVQDLYGKRLHTAMLTLTASSTPNGDPLPCVDHLDELLSSWSSVSRTLRRVLDGRRSARLAILEPHPSDGANNGYLHIHIAVFVDGKINPEMFQPVIESHVNNCDLAGWTAHDLEKDSTISVRHAGADRNDSDDQLDELAVYLAEYLGTYGDDPLGLPEHVQAANALLWSTGRQRWRPSNGAQQHMATDPRDPDSDWQLVGIEKDGEVIPVDPENGGVDRFVTGSPNPPDPPPTDH